MTGIQFLVQNLAQFMPMPQAQAFGKIAEQIDAEAAKDKTLAERALRIAELEAEIAKMLPAAPIAP